MDEFIGSQIAKYDEWVKFQKQMIEYLRHQLVEIEARTDVDKAAFKSSLNTLIDGADRNIKELERLRGLYGKI